jgi:hypothetical protein
MVVYLRDAQEVPFQRTGVASKPALFAVEKCYYCYFLPHI